MKGENDAVGQAEVWHQAFRFDFYIFNHYRSNLPLLRNKLCEKFVPVLGSAHLFNNFAGAFRTVNQMLDCG